MYLKEETINTINIEKSRFICYMKHVKTEEEYKEYLSSIRKKHHDATHVCSAFVCHNIQRSNDDGEPSGTAGAPILNVLNKNGLDEMCALVVRYFGGIKLGAGGLIRAYTKSLTEALKDKELVDLVKASIIELEFDYDKLKNIDNTINSTNSKLLDKSFDKVIKYKILVSNDNLDKFSNYNKIKDTITYI